MEFTLKLSSIIFFIITVTLYCYALQLQNVYQALFTRALTYLKVYKRETEICFVDTMDMVVKLQAGSAAHCISKCRVATSMNLKGINYMTSVGSCSCVPKMNVLYNVTADLTGGCLAFVTHDCPLRFDYLVENHKCYSLQFTANDWNTSRSNCNNLLNSHPVVIDSSDENTLVRLYSLAEIARNPNATMKQIWTAGYRINVNGSPTPFYWATYPDQNQLIEEFFWTIENPGVPYNGRTNCIRYILNIGWADIICTSQMYVLCEVDLH
ncbi:hypothetical protein HELRODRAFT_183216 [Helobdella robusta]|uniref:C-type lectin domain-containing protein n=1 Tax=Helobdella robusta TaxID=6412 RepID=T1FJB7_HELRO|nr:hypothetical protein HELRODRAFT_183216 [Helobdella robusta]ESO11430.1 hypothetical protein HELRODRAFT_183216 [Helobdella robusta]